MNSTTRTPELLGIVGTGLMGRGIAQIAAQGGIPVILYDNRPGGAQEAKEAIVATLGKLAAKGKLGTDDVAAAEGRLAVATSLGDLAPCTTVVEAIIEKLEAKRELFKQLEAWVSEQCILATNTSSLSVTAIAAACKHPGRVAGFHFFSPVPLMKIVEVIGGPLTDARVSDSLTDMALRMGHTPVRASDTPGFIVTHAEIDRILRLGAGFRMGPFELLDLTGLDVSQPVMESIYDQYYQEPRFRPSPIARQRLAAGLLGRKSQRGFYRYENGQKVEIATPVVPARDDLAVWISGDAAAAYPAVIDLLNRLGIQPDHAERPGEASLCLVLPIGQDVSTVAVAAGLDPVRCVGLDPLFLKGCRTLMITPVTAPRYRNAAHALFTADGTPVAVIQD